MRDNPKEPSKELPKLLKDWFQGAKGRAKEQGQRLFNSPGLRGGAWKRIPGKLQNLEVDFKKIELKNISQYSGWIRLGLLTLAVFLLAETTSRIIGIFIRPTYPNIPAKVVSTTRVAPAEDYDAILRRNIFNVEGKIPDPFDQGRLDCMSQARPTTQRLVLLGTIVTNDEIHSVALVQEESNPLKIAVKKDDVFFDKFQALKVERKRLCFQVKATQDFEFVEIPEEGGNVASAPSLTGITSDGIQPVSETEYVVKQNFLDKNLADLNNILQTARAVPYVEPGSGKFKGFLVQSVDANSPFAQLGIRQGDILTGVNDILLDNAGKGLEAFQQLRNARKVSLHVLRGGQDTALSYDVK